MLVVTHVYFGQNWLILIIESLYMYYTVYLINQVFMQNILLYFHVSCYDLILLFN
jgi:hypothetical protein